MHPPGGNGLRLPSSAIGRFPTVAEGSHTFLSLPERRSIAVERFLHRLRALGDLGDADVAAVAETTFDVVAVRSDTDLTRAGERVDLLHVLAEGWAFRNILLRDGRRQIPALYLPGDLCELDALAADRLDCSITTLVPCRVARLGKAALSAAIRRRAEVGRAFLALACRENALLTQWNVALGRKSAREHVAHFLCELVVRLGDGTDTSVRDTHALPLTQTELADAFGLTAVHVNRVLQGLRRDGLVELCRERLRILDWPRLVAVGGFDAGYLGRADPPVASTLRRERPNLSRFHSPGVPSPPP